jgi:hypothetical protein
VSALLAGLPWLHTRFAVLAGGFGALVLWALVTDRSRPARARIRRALRFAALPVVSAAGWFAFFRIIYGTFNPAAPYGDTSGPGGTHLMYVPGGLAGLLFDEQFGLLAYAPVLAAAVAGLWAGGTTRLRSAMWAAVAVAAAYLAAAATYWMWFAGVPATPARFATAVLPVFALPLAVAWRRAGTAGRSVMLVLLAVSGAITALVVTADRAGLAWNPRDAEARWLEWLGPVVNLARGWPSFFWRLNPGHPTSEWPFAVHVLVWAAVFAGGWLAMARLGRRRAWAAGAWRLAAAWWLALGVMAAVQTGWWLTAAHGLDPAPSQMAVLDAMRSDRPVWRIGAWSVRRVRSAAGLVTIQTRDPGRTDGPPPWMSLSDVPPGVYDVRIPGSATPGEARLTVGRAPRPLRTFPIGSASSQAFAVTLPAGAAALVMTAAGESGHEPPGSVELVPVALRPGAGPLARSAAPFGGTDAFFEDDHVFVEDTGFWVRGGQTAAVTFAAGGGQTAVALTLRNGGAPNDVTLTGDGVNQRLAMQAGEERSVSLPVRGPGGVCAVRIESAGGFRPSAVSASRDSRYLGVWVGVR